MDLINANKLKTELKKTTDIELNAKLSFCDKLCEYYNNLARSNNEFYGESYQADGERYLSMYEKYDTIRTYVITEMRNRIDSLC